MEELIIIRDEEEVLFLLPVYIVLGLGEVVPKSLGRIRVIDTYDNDYSNVFLSEAKLRDYLRLMKELDKIGIQWEK